QLRPSSEDDFELHSVCKLWHTCNIDASLTRLLLMKQKHVTTMDLFIFLHHEMLIVLFTSHINCNVSK
ncbi:hypothetical protein Droror1_Dr00000412, partial [Drosera rotundifolia]